MNKQLQKILDTIQNNKNLSTEEKADLLKALKDADKEFEITAFKLERTEQVKRTTAILLEETIEELEQKRKAVEAQNRELEIEAALERVRAAAMGMKEPSNMLDVCRIISEQLQALNLKEIRNVQTAIFYEFKGLYLNYEYFRLYDKTFITEVKYNLQPDVDAFVNKMMTDPEAFFTKSFKKSELKDWIEYQKNANQFVDPKLNEAESLHYYFYSIGSGALGLSTYNIQLNETELSILKRFRNVFELAYRRFIDIELAIAQAREAQIEAALEKVRAVAMGMNKPEDILSISKVLFTELKRLGFGDIRNTLISIFNDDDGFYHDYDYSDLLGGSITKIFYNSHPAIENFINQVRKADDAFAEHIIDSNQMNKWEEFRKILGKQPDPRLEYLDVLYYYNYSIGSGSIGISNFKPITEEQLEILKRFRNVFELSYRRYNDIAQAEAQAREAQIEAALEKVRGRAMAMRNSSDLSAAASLVFSELKKLNIDSIRCGVVLLTKINRTAQLYAAAASPDNDSLALIGTIEMSGHSSFDQQYEHWLKKENYFTALSKEELKAYYEALNSCLEVPYSSAGHNQKEYGYYFSFSEGLFYTWTVQPYQESEINILNRFKSIIDLTFRRYIELKKAEEQAKEAKIEAALERVRAKAMSMRSSEDFVATIGSFYRELSSLRITPRRCGVGLLNKESRIAELSTMNTTGEGDSIEILGRLKMEGHPVLAGVYDNWLLQKEYHPVLRGNEIKEYYQLLKPQISIPDYPNDLIQYGYFFFFPEGGVYSWTEKELTEDELQIYRRFTSVLSLTYRRFLDLKEAEARAAEAVKQSSLDRVRAEIASMRTAEDLNRITPIIWRELNILDVPFFRCGVFIVDELQAKVHVYLTTPDGKSLGVLNLSIDSNELTYNAVEHWRMNKVYKEHWNKEEFINWTKSMIELGQVQNAVTYQGSSTPPETLDLHFVPFTQGMMYVGNTSPLTEEKIQLVKSLAEAFSIAYARYEDFKNLEEAKNKVEVTLNELKSAQVQLIHSEKMASLGELTAGIAHEIKNPLNFVNNFSEISRELLDEMKIELQNNNIGEVIEIVEDLKQNLEKINHHGKRADSIVKGMLLHSRGGSGDKVPTNINDLLDQFVSLAYHGMRAQDKEFNISIEKYFDKSIEKINVVPQDISRVFLNIINNACYAAYDKKKKSDDDFSPLLKVSTKGFNGKVEIRIGDNGNGMPADILDKIFQPFFTTKPTGEGTGLGLSLSYDIVKAHGGELKVETKEGEGSEFIIQIPFSS